MVMADNSSDDDRTMWVGNVDNKVTEEMLWELFLQAGPLESVKIPKDFKTGRQKNFAFVKFQHSISVRYVIDLMDGICLFDTSLRLCPKNKSTTNGGATDVSQRQDTPKRRRMNEDGPEEYPPRGHPMNPNFPGPWEGMPPQMMAQAQYHMQAMHPPHWRQQSFQGRGLHREGSPYGHSEWGNRGEPRSMSGRSRREDHLAMRRSHSTPNHLDEEEHGRDRRRGDPYSRHERRRR